MNRLKVLAVSLVILLFSGVAYAQKNGVKATIIDAQNNQAIEFATVSITRENQTKPTKYVLSDSKGAFELTSLRKGKYTIKAELLGYLPYTKELEIADDLIDLGSIKLELDSEMIDAATVTALANPVVIKKDTIEYNADAYRITDNDVLEDLLMKLPGVEIGENGSISVNGETVSKITIDGKTFFLNDPSLASQNIPAKLVRKLKVIKKKSEQAEFTGIDDGEEQTVIDINVRPGMMQGLLGNISAGVGHDVPSAGNTMNDWRYTGNAFVGSFTDNQQISLIVNASNTNGRGGRGGRGGGMMAMGSGGGGGGGITTSTMAGLNGAWDLFDGDMSLGGNYMFNNSNNISNSVSDRINYVKERIPGKEEFTTYNLLNHSESKSTRRNDNHSVGMRLDHKFSENTSILFEPSISFGYGNSSSSSLSDSYKDTREAANKQNDATSFNSNDSKNFSANGFLLFRQRLGIPGRTLTANVRFNINNSNSKGLNRNTTNYYNGAFAPTDNVDQLVDNVSKTYNINSRLTFTEPMGDNFYIEANYNFRWNKSESNKESRTNIKTETLNIGDIDPLYSNFVINNQKEQEIGAHALYQSNKMSAQIGFSAIYTNIYNKTKAAQDREYNESRWRFSPTVMILANPNDDWNFRIFYTGSTNQPSVNQLAPIPDNTNPLNITFGNPGLHSYFSHNLRTNVRYNNRQKMSSFNISVNGGYTQSPIINTSWRDAKGVRYSMPFNGKDSGNASFNMFFNLPIGKSAFSINNTMGASFNRSSDYQGTNIDMSEYTNKGFYAFMDWFQAKFNDPNWYKEYILENTTDVISLNDRFRLTYRGKAFEASLSGSTRVNSSHYSLRNEKTLTWNNSVSSSFTWDWQQTGISLDIDYDYRWYNGYATQQPSQNVLNIELSKLILNNNVTLTLSGYDILGQSRNLMVSDTENYHSETLSNTLGRFIVLSATWRFGSMGNRRGGFGGPGGGRMPGGFGGQGGGGRPPMMGGGRPR